MQHGSRAGIGMVLSAYVAHMKDAFAEQHRGNEGSQPCHRIHCAAINANYLSPVKAYIDTKPIYRCYHADRV